MLLFKGATVKKLEANNAICDIIRIMLADRLIKEWNLDNSRDYELALMGFIIRWVAPKLDYDFDKDLGQIASADIKKRIIENEDNIYLKGLDLLNSDSLLSDLIAYYVVYEVYLVNLLYPKDGSKRYSGMKRLNKFLFQSLEELPDAQSNDFKENYKNLLIQFNKEYGTYSKPMREETIHSLLSML
jgi:hypothetical protein